MKIVHVPCSNLVIEAITVDDQFTSIPRAEFIAKHQEEWEMMVDRAYDSFKDLWMEIKDTVLNNDVRERVDVVMKEASSPGECIDLLYEVLSEKKLVIIANILVYVLSDVTSKDLGVWVHHED